MMSNIVTNKRWQPLEKITDEKLLDGKLGKITINETKTMRGCNDLYYQIEVEGLNYFATIEYRRSIKDMFHLTPMFEEMNRQPYIDLEYFEKRVRPQLEKTIELLEQVQKTYVPFIWE